jgi:hypothetical protein
MHSDGEAAFLGEAIDFEQGLHINAVGLGNGGERLSLF